MGLKAKIFQFKMISLHINIIMLILAFCSAEPISQTSDLTVPDETGDTATISTMPNNSEDLYELLATIEKFEEVASKKDELIDDDIFVNNETMVKLLEKILKLVTDNKNAQLFVKVKGMDRIVIPHVENENLEMKKVLLKLVATVFSSAPIMAKSYSPLSLLDKLLFIFENDNNLAHKAYAMDIMHDWLPGKPRLQARVMKFKGLDLFYDQITKLDYSVINTMLDLFNSILAEHINFFNDKDQLLLAHPDKIQTYQKIGLIYRMSTPKVCRGILYIIQMALSQAVDDDNTILMPVLELLSHTREPCINAYRGKEKAINLFQELLKYYNTKFNSEPSTISDESNFKDSMEDYIERLKSPADKDEF